MLELRPNCGLCDRDLPPQSPDARICSYECTYCANCVETVLRPIRPQQAWRPDMKLGLDNNPGGTRRRHVPFDQADIAAHVERIRHLPPDHR